MTSVALVLDDLVAGTEEAHTGDDRVRPAGQLAEHAARVLGVGRLAVDASVEDDGGVDTERDVPVSVRPSAPCPPHAARTSSTGSASGGSSSTYDGATDLERDAQLLEDRAALRRGRGECQAVLRATHRSSDGHFRAQSAVTAE